MIVGSETSAPLSTRYSVLRERLDCRLIAAIVQPSESSRCMCACALFMRRIVHHGEALVSLFGGALVSQKKLAMLRMTCHSLAMR